MRRPVRTWGASLALGVAAVACSATPAHATWAVVGTDPRTGQVGAAVASCVDVRDLTSTMALLPRTGAMVGLSAGRPDAPAYAAALMRDGRSAGDTVAALTDPRHDAGRDSRQYAVAVSGRGTASHTGADVAGVTRESADGTAVVQTTLAASDAVAGEAVTAFDRTEGQLTDRLLAALQAGSAAGGDRGCGAAQSASLVVLGPRSALQVPGAAGATAADGTNVAALVGDASLTPEEVAERAQRLHQSALPTGEAAPLTYLSMVTAPGTDAVARLAERKAALDRARAARTFVSSDTTAADPSAELMTIAALAAFALVGVLAAVLVIVGMRRANARLAADATDAYVDEEDEPRRRRSADVPKLFDIDASVARRRARALAAARQRAEADADRAPSRAGHW